ncbi:MAG: AMP-binding protein [Desulfuromonadales bacterium]|nr:AMP-binding protein [Desulfuromonadales bacterium]MBN2793750.1 AMP-binding protein [Desulfuromonadales bacterium]
MNPSTGQNIASHLPRMAARQPDSTALYLPQGEHQPYAEISFQSLNRESDRIARALETINIRRGTRTALMVTPGLDFFALTFALFKVGAVPVLIDPGIGVKNLKACLEEAAPQAFIGIPKAHLARVLFGWGRTTLKTLLTVGKKGPWGGASLDRIKQSVPEDGNYAVVTPDADEMAAILFTSGSTGVPKGVVYTHGNFIAQVELLQKIYNIQPGEVDLPTFPLFALFAPALGMASVIPVMDFTRPGSVNPENIIKPILKFNITTMFGSPALINRVGRYGAEHDIVLPSLKRAISAGAPVPARVLEQFCHMLNADTQVFTPYGATESLPVCSIGSSEILSETARLTDQGKGVCVGHPVPGIELAIIHISDDPIENWDSSLLVKPGDIGEIVVSGPQVTRSYFQRADSTRSAKIHDHNRQIFYHRMGDLGYRDTQGRIWFCGRKSQRVVCRDRTFYTIPCEAVINTHPEVYRSALVGVRGTDSVVPVICIEPERTVTRTDLPALLKEVRRIAAENPLTRPIQHFLVHRSFPVDIRHNAKIFREKLAAWARRRVQ